MDPMTLMALASAVPAIAQGITGFAQSGKAKNILKDLQRPTYTIPTEATKALSTAKNIASSMQMAGQQNVQQRIDQSSANALYGIEQNATSGAEALAALTGVYANQMGQENQLGANAAMDYERRQQAAQSAMNTYAGWQDKAWDYNVNQPYQDKLNAAQALAQAGMTNKYQGLKSLAGVGANAIAGMNPKATGSLASDAMAENTSMVGTNEVNNLTKKQVNDIISGIVGKPSMPTISNPNVPTVGGNGISTGIDLGTQSVSPEYLQNLILMNQPKPIIF